MTQTPNFQLNQWSGDDYVRRTDFNADNAKVDAALAAASARLGAEASVTVIPDGVGVIVSNAAEE